MIIIVFHQNKLTKLLLNATHCSFPEDLGVIKEAETLVLQRESGTADMNLVPEGLGRAGAKSSPGNGRDFIAPSPACLQRSPCPALPGQQHPLTSPTTRCAILAQGFVAPVTFPHWLCPTLAKRLTWHRIPTHH